MCVLMRMCHAYAPDVYTYAHVPSSHAPTPAPDVCVYVHVCARACAQVLGEMDAREEWSAAAEILRRLPDAVRHGLVDRVAQSEPALLARTLQVRSRAAVDLGITQAVWVRLLCTCRRAVGKIAWGMAIWFCSSPCRRCSLGIAAAPVVQPSLIKASCLTSGWCSNCVCWPALLPVLLFGVCRRGLASLGAGLEGCACQATDGHGIPACSSAFPTVTSTLRR